MTINDAHVLVTGADGFIGSHVVEALLDQGARVRALAQYTSFGTTGWLDRLPPARRALVDIRLGDIRDPFFVQDLVAGQEVVLHLAALIAIPFSYRAPQSYVEVNVTGTLNVLEACKRAGVRRMVHTSTSEVYGTALYTPIDEKHPLQGQSPYSASKIGADQMVESYTRSFDLPAVILRPFNTFGPRQSERAVIPTVIRQALDPACAEIRLGALDPVRDFNFVEDVAESFCTAGFAAGLDHGVPYNVATGSAVTVGEMVEHVRALTGCGKPVRQDDARARPPKSEVFELRGESALFRAATGWAPRHDLEAGLARTIEWWREELAAGRNRAEAGYAV